MQRVSAFLIVVLCYIGLFCAFVAWDHFSEYSGPTAKAGHIDLAHWNFEKNGSIELNGQWYFYPDQLLTPETTQHGKNRRLITVPEKTRNANSIKPYYVNAGTYRLVIYSDHEQMFGLRATHIYNSSRIYVNGMLVGGSGRPSKGDSKVASLKPAVSYFPLQRGYNELLIQVARADVATAWGITKPITFGTQQQISRSYDRSIFSDMVTVAAFFFMGLYFFGYFVQRRQDAHLLFFSVICLLFSMIISWISPGRVIYIFFPDLSYRALVILEVIETLLLGVVVLLHLFSTYPKLVSKKVLTWGIGISCATLIIDFIPWSPLTPMILFLHSFLAVSILTYTSYIFVLAIVRKTTESIYLMVATLSMSIFIIITTIRSYSSSMIISLYTFSSLIFLLMLSLLISQRFAHALKRNESLARELVRSDQLKDEFIARTSHEFRTPLNGIINAAQTLLVSRSDRTIGDEADKFQIITRIGYRLSALVNDVLDLEKIRQGKLSLHPIPLDVAAAVKSELPFYSLLAKKKGLVLANAVPENLPLVSADENRFRQILNNLIGNAIKYTPAGKITLQARKIEQVVEITVTDTGTGIPRSEFEAIFQAFERRDKLNQSEGAGLGLSIVKQLVELQNGKVWVQSEAGSGSVFHFTLPLFNAKQGSSHETFSQSAERTGTDEALLNGHLPEVTLETPYHSPFNHATTILVVDDDLENLKILIDMLTGMSYNVTAVKNGKEALDEIAHSKPDAVILDLMMPGMSGYDVCHKIREQYSLTELPVLMLTAAIIDEEKHYAFRAGANDILQKPYNFSEFSARVHGLILMKNAASQATNMEVAFLQSQIRPHFLYNVLNSIIALSYENVEKAREMTAQFAAYLRGSFDFQNTSAISTFKKELALVRNYLTIEKMRFHDQLQFSIDVDERIDFPMPPLMIQPLVDYAVEHSIGGRKEGRRIILSVTRLPNGYKIAITDNGIGMDEQRLNALLTDASGSSFGIKNVNERLKRYFGTHLDVQSKIGEGTTVSYCIIDGVFHHPPGSGLQNAQSESEKH
ncbi:ATP-binding protein [Sporolactobacillus sp. CPB3-1]|uniref:histidine kinase n=1 Tax=Sporolactobacillus mangiferae TaxID=2940498 RepID=A0ABT0M920_9BACL|nr:ATP-binding protein [Sporolactobacillus mangiferae]